jgi:hypothetical protein
MMITQGNPNAAGMAHARHGGKAVQRGDMPVAVFWDIENCQVPSAARSVDIAGAVRSTVGRLGYVGPLVKFAAYGDFNLIRTDVRSELQV